MIVWDTNVLKLKAQFKQEQFSRLCKRKNNNGTTSQKMYNLIHRIGGKDTVCLPISNPEVTC